LSPTQMARAVRRNKIAPRLLLLPPLLPLRTSHHRSAAPPFFARPSFSPSSEFSCSPSLPPESGFSPCGPNPLPLGRRFASLRSTAFPTKVTRLFLQTARKSRLSGGATRRTGSTSTFRR